MNLFFKSFLSYKLNHWTRAALWIQAKEEAAFHNWVRLVQMLGEGWLMWVAATSQEPVEITIADSALYCIPFLSCGGGHSAHHPYIINSSLPLLRWDWGSSVKPVSPAWDFPALQQRPQVAEQVCCEVLIMPWGTISDVSLSSDFESFILCSLKLGDLPV